MELKFGSVQRILLGEDKVIQAPIGVIVEISPFHSNPTLPLKPWNRPINNNRYETIQSVAAWPPSNVEPIPLPIPPFMVGMLGGESADVQGLTSRVLPFDISCWGFPTAGRRRGLSTKAKLIK